MADPHSSNSPDNPTLAKNRTVDAVVSVVLMLIGAVVIVAVWIDVVRRKHLLKK